MNGVRTNDGWAKCNYSFASMKEMEADIVGCFETKIKWDQNIKNQAKKNLRHHSQASKLETFLNLNWMIYL